MQVSCTVHIVHVFAMIMNYVTTGLELIYNVVYANIMCTIDVHIIMMLFSRQLIFLCSAKLNTFVMPQ